MGCTYFLTKDVVKKNKMLEFLYFLVKIAAAVLIIKYICETIQVYLSPEKKKKKQKLFDPFYIDEDKLERK